MCIKKQIGTKYEMVLLATLHNKTTNKIIVNFEFYNNYNIYIDNNCYYDNIN